MARNEKTSKKIAKIASRLLKKSTSKKVRKVSGSALTQAPDRRKHKRK